MNDILIHAFNDELEKISGVRNILKNLGGQAAAASDLALRGSRAAARGVRGVPSGVKDVAKRKVKKRYSDADDAIRKRIGLPTQQDSIVMQLFAEDDPRSYDIRAFREFIKNK